MNAARNNCTFGLISFAESGWPQRQSERELCAGSQEPKTFAPEREANAALITHPAAAALSYMKYQARPLMVFIASQAKEGTEQHIMCRVQCVM